MTARALLHELRQAGLSLSVTAQGVLQAAALRAAPHDNDSPPGRIVREPFATTFPRTSSEDMPRKAANSGGTGPHKVDIAQSDN